MTAPVRTKIGYHASHEQFPPGRLLECAVLAEQAGFEAIMCSDHLFPWTGDQQSGVGFAYAWLGAAMRATSLPMGVVSAPGVRYHPTVLAQAGATLAEMFPGRLWQAFGSGEYLNEHVTGEAWPDKSVRKARLLECVEVTRRLWRGEMVDHEGLVRVHKARVFSTAEKLPQLFAAAVSAETARWAGAWADGMITVNSSPQTVREVVQAFAEGGGGGKPVRLQYHLSWAESPDEATAQVDRHWRNVALTPDQSWDTELPSDVDRILAGIGPDEVARKVPVSNDPAWHTEQIAEYAAIGFDQIMLHNVGANQERFIAVFGEKVLPHFTA